MKYLYALFPFLASFWVFLHTLYGTIAPYRDSGDLVSSSFTLGIAHPPGYCLYILLGKLFIQLVPWGNIAYRIQLYSAFFSSLCIVIFLVILRDVNRFRRGPGARSAWVDAGFTLAGFAAIFSAASWSLSQVAEMYPQQVFLSLVIIWLVLRFYFEQDNSIKLSWICLAGLIFGLSLGMHQTVILLIPGCAFLVIRKILMNKDSFAGRRWLKCSGFVFMFFLIGFMIYAYIPIRSLQEPVADWGNAENFRGFWRLITRADYGMLKLHPGESKLVSSFSGFFEQIMFFMKNMLKQFNPFILAIGLVGVGLSFRMGLGWFFMILFVFAGPFFSLIANLPPGERTSYPILETNLVMPNIIIGLWLGLVFMFMDKFSNKVKALGLSVVFLLLVFQIKSGYSLFDRRENFIAYDYGKNIFRTAEKGACIYDPDDSTTFITEYLYRAHNMREDVKRIVYFRTLWGARRLSLIYPDVMPQETFSDARAYLAEFFRENIGSMPIYGDLPGKVPEQFGYVPKGSLYRFLGANPSRREMNAYLLAAGNMWKFYALRFDYDDKANSDFFNQQILSYYMSGLNNLGLKYASIQKYEEAMKNYQRALSFNVNFYEVYNNIGIIHYGRNDYETALKYFRLGLERKPGEALLYYNIGLAYRKKGNYEKAFENLRKAKTAPAFNEMGNIFLDKDELKSAEEYFKEAVKTDRNYLYAYYNLGVVYERRGDYESAGKYYKMYKDLVVDPDEKKSVDERLKKISWQ